MGVISVISYGSTPSKGTVEYIAGQEVLCVGALVSRRKVKRFIARHGIDRAVLTGTALGFALAELERAGVKICTGEKFMSAVYPKLIARAAKMDKSCFSCTVYDSAADAGTLDVIKCAAALFRHVSLCTEADATALAEEVMESMGLALKLGEAGGVGIVCSGRGGRQRVRVDLTGRSTTVFIDENRTAITPSLAEALAGDDLDGDVLDRLKLKIYSLC